MRISELNAGAVIFSLVFVVMFLLCMRGVYDGAMTVYRAEYSPTWQTVTGTISSSRLVQVSKRGQTARVTYYYIVDGVNYRSETINFGGYFLGGRGRSSADVVAQYQPGKQVKVFYQPEMPGVACLEPGSYGWNIYLNIPIAGLLALFALGNLYSILRSV